MLIINQFLLLLFYPFILAHFNNFILAFLNHKFFLFIFFLWADNRYALGYFYFFMIFLFNSFSYYYFTFKHHFFYDILKDVRGVHFFFLVVIHQNATQILLKMLLHLKVLYKPFNVSFFRFHFFQGELELVDLQIMQIIWQNFLLFNVFSIALLFSQQRTVNIYRIWLDFFKYFFNLFPSFFLVIYSGRTLLGLIEFGHALSHQILITYTLIFLFPTILFIMLQLIGFFRFLFFSFSLLRLQRVVLFGQLRLKLMT